MGNLNERLGEAPVDDKGYDRKNRGWEEDTGGTPITTRGDIIVGDSVGIAVRKAIGLNGQVLISNGLDLEYASLPGGGDMLKVSYDSVDNGIVNESRLLGGQNSAYHLDRTNHTGTQTVSTISDFDAEVTDNTDVAANTVHRGSDGSDHSNVVLNDNHRGGSGADHSDVALNTTHRGSDGKNHADVVLNNTHRNGSGADHTNVGLNDAHRISDGKGHSDVVLNNSHRAGNGADHANVALNDTHRVSDGKNHSDVVLNNTHRAIVTGNPHVVTKAEVNLGNADNTSDVNKPVSTAQQTEIDTKEDDLGNPSSDGDILSSTIAGARSWVTPSAGGGQPLEVEDESVSLDADVTKLNFLGAGVTAVENADHEIDITIPGGSGLALGETDSTAYRGDRGKIAYDHSQLVTGNPHSLDTDDVTEATNEYYTEGKVDANTNVAANTTHRGSDGKNHADVVLNNTHRASDGKNHADVVTNNAKVSNANHSGDATGDTVLTIANNAITTIKVLDSNITLAKLADIATARIMGRITAASGVQEELTAAQVRTLLELVIGTDVQDNIEVVTSANEATWLADTDNYGRLYQLET